MQFVVYTKPDRLTIGDLVTGDLFIMSEEADRPHKSGVYLLCCNNTFVNIANGVARVVGEESADWEVLLVEGVGTMEFRLKITDPVPEEIDNE